MISTQTINSKICDLSLDIQKIIKKLSKLEAANEQLSQKVTNESIQRQNLEKHTMTTHEAFSSQLQILKDSYDRFDNVITSTMEKTKMSILEEVAKKNQNLIKLIESDIKVGKDANTTLEATPSRADIDNKFIQIENLFQNEFKQYRSELNDNVVKVEFFEKKLNELYSSLNSQVSEANKGIFSLNQEISQIKNFKKNTIQNFQKFQKDFITNDEIITNFSNKVESIAVDIGSKLKNYDDLFQNHISDLANIKNDVYNQMKEINVFLNEKFKEINKESKLTIEGHKKEIDNFEKHMLSEYDKFIAFIQKHLEEQDSNMKKLFDYANDDITLLKSKGETYEGLIKKLRADVFKSINETEEFLEKKYESIFRLVNK